MVNKSMVQRLRVVPLVLLASLMALPSTGCVAVGYSSGGGWFIWPGGLGLLLLVLLGVFLMRRR